MTISLGRRKRQGLKLALAFLSAAAVASASAGSAVASSATFIAHDCSPKWIGASGQMMYDSRNPSGLMDAYIGGKDCQGQPLLPAFAGHRGISDVTPDGRYVLLETDMGSPPGQAQAEPGKGVGDELQLLDRQTGTLTQLTASRRATIWARFTKPDGSEVMWSELTKSCWDLGDCWNDLLGWWQVHLADVVNGQLQNERTYANPNGGGFIETYGRLPGTNMLMFASDAGVQPPNGFMRWLGSQDWLVPDTLDKSPTRLTPAFPTWWGGRESDYFEFMSAAPVGMFDGAQWILTSLARDATGGGMDLWRIRPDGTGLTRVTWFGGQPSGWGQYAQVAGYPSPQYVVIGDVVFDPADPHSLYLGAALDQNAKNSDAYKLSL